MISVIKANIKQQIKEHNTTAIKVCEMLHEDRRYLWRMTDKVQAAKIIRIANAIGCEPSELFKGL